MTRDTWSNWCDRQIRTYNDLIDVMAKRARRRRVIRAIGWVAAFLILMAVFAYTWWLTTPL